MKTILSLILLPVMTLAQPMAQYQEEQFNIEFSMDINKETIVEKETDISETAMETVEFFITVEIYIEELWVDSVLPKLVPNEAVPIALPKYLHTFSLLGRDEITKKSQKPQEHLNRLLALNNPMFPKENTLVDWLHPVRYQQNKFEGIENISEGFGPRIRL